MNNIAHLIEHRVQTHPNAVWGSFGKTDTLANVVKRAHATADAFKAAGLRRGDMVAVLGTNCSSYMVVWLAVQLAGLQAAMVNPGYPDEFLTSMLDDITPQAIIWVARDPRALIERDGLHLDATGAWDGKVETLRADARFEGRAPNGSGQDCTREDIAFYVHTSGTSGKPKFCALSHEYFFRLGRYFSDCMALTDQDTLLAPLPLFHINPMYGLIGGLTTGASIVTMDRFSAAEFWAGVKNHGVTVLLLHGPPAALLKTKTTTEDAAGHKVRMSFFSDPAFLNQFKIPIGVGGYGSTESGGYCFHWKFRPDDPASIFPPEGPTHQSGPSRYDLEWKLGVEDELLVREKAPGVMFSGYVRGGGLDPCRDADGWFQTGDRGRYDAYGNLIFVERASESIRVNAEYVPIDFVEDRLRKVASLGEFALWKVPCAKRGHEAVVYTTSVAVDVVELKSVVADLPKYMHPTRILRIAAIPRDAGVGKTQRRLLGDQAVLETVTL
ncbi:MAG TPA: class I adenylate-forming enzyme family protein [Caulobacteraceae bacterium]